MVLIANPSKFLFALIQEFLRSIHFTQADFPLLIGRASSNAVLEFLTPVVGGKGYYRRLLVDGGRPSAGMQKPVGAPIHYDASKRDLVLTRVAMERRLLPPRRSE